MIVTPKQTNASIPAKALQHLPRIVLCTSPELLSWHTGKEILISNLPNRAGITYAVN